MVTPNRYPDSISFMILGNDEDTLIKYLTAYQKTRAEWDVFRNKIPEELLLKFQRVLSECRENGFINPRVEGGKLTWSQILTSPRSRKNSNKCTLCNKNITSGTCIGKLKTINNRRMFVECWNENT